MDFDPDNCTECMQNLEACKSMGGHPEQPTVATLGDALKVRIYKPSGKWYADETVRVRDRDDFEGVCADLELFLRDYGAGYMAAFETPDRENHPSCPHMVICRG